MQNSAFATAGLIERNCPMTTTLQDFTKTKAYLICVDSDGCAMDTMNVKHKRCFGPCLVEEWGLQPWAEPILARWDAVNLYTMTRGINRFKGLAIVLRAVDTRYTRIDGLDEFTAWAETAPELSNAALAEAVTTAQGPCLAKALHWSQTLNAAIAALPEAEKKPFPGVAEGLAAAHAVADVAVVSSANREAVEEEWERCGLLGAVDVLCCQDSGSKAACIAALLGKGYAPNHVLMVGDAPGDRDAAHKNGVLFYPILVRHEAESWAKLAQNALPSFMEGSYPCHEAMWEQDFEKNLGKADI